MFTFAFRNLNTCQTDCSDCLKPGSERLPEPYVKNIGWQSERYARRGEKDRVTP